MFWKHVIYVKNVLNVRNIQPGLGTYLPTVTYGSYSFTPNTSPRKSFVWRALLRDRSDTSRSRSAPTLRAGTEVTVLCCACVHPSHYAFGRNKRWHESDIREQSLPRDVQKGRSEKDIRYASSSPVTAWCRAHCRSTYNVGYLTCC